MTSNLPKMFRRVLGIFKITVIIFGAVIVALSFMPERFLDGAQLSLSPLGLAPQGGNLRIRLDNGAADVVSLQNLRATLLVRPTAADAGLIQIYREFGVPVLVSYVAFVALVLDLLQRLFRGVERGESFTERNVRLVYIIGIAIIVFTNFASVANSVYSERMVSYLAAHATLPDFNAALVAAAPDSGGLVSFSNGRFAWQFSWAGIFIGGLILALGEVFRQGLALKKESELTI